MNLCDWYGIERNNLFPKAATKIQNIMMISVLRVLKEEEEEEVRMANSNRYCDSWLLLVMFLVMNLVIFESLGINIFSTLCLKNL